MKNPIYTLLLKIKNSGAMSGLSGKERYFALLFMLAMMLIVVSLFVNWFPDAMQGNSVVDATPTEFPKQEAAPVDEPAKELDKEVISNVLFAALLAPLIIAILVFAWKLIREIWYV